MSAFAEPVVAHRGSTEPNSPLVVRLHGRGSNEAERWCRVRRRPAPRRPLRYAGTAVLYGTLPFDAGVPTTADRLDGARVLVIHGDQDAVIPRELLVKVFEDFAAVDLISGGRAEITAGRGAYSESFPRFGFDVADYDELFEEKLDLPAHALR